MSNNAAITEFPTQFHQRKVLNFLNKLVASVVNVIMKGPVVQLTTPPDIKINCKEDLFSNVMQSQHIGSKMLDMMEAKLNSFNEISDEESKAYKDLWEERKRLYQI